MNREKRLSIPREHFHGINKKQNGVNSKLKLTLPCACEKGCLLVRFLEKQLKQSLPNNMKPNIIFTGAKLSSKLLKNMTYIIYRSVCTTESYNEYYVGKCARKLYEHVKDHNGGNHSSHLVKQTGETGHLPVDIANFEVIGSRYHNNTCHRKIADLIN